MKTAPEAHPTGHRERLLREGLRHFYATGFHGTSVDDLLAAAGAPKGSFYHHFGSKNAFAKVVIAEYMAQQLALLKGFAARSDLTALQKITAYFAELQSRLERKESRVGCLVGKFATELAPSSAEFSSVLSGALKDWRVVIAKLMTEGHKDGSIRRDMSSTQQAVLLQSLIQGSLVLALAERSHESLAVVRSNVPLLFSSRQASG
jgi:TetR/AcrR family transcriptional repressor of nem operon